MPMQKRRAVRINKSMLRGALADQLAVKSAQVGDAGHAQKKVRRALRKRCVIRAKVDRYATVASSLEYQFPGVRREYRFCSRLWRFDFAWPDYKVALEIEGGVWINGGHNRGSGFMKNVEKYNHAAAEGWRVIKTTPRGAERGDYRLVLFAAITNVKEDLERAK